MMDHLLPVRHGGGAHDVQGLMATGDVLQGATSLFHLSACPIPSKTAPPGRTVRLSAFIQANLDVILEEWDAFARTQLPAGRTLSDNELRDHSRAVLLAIAGDMEIEQSDAERSAKSRQVHKSQAADTAASSHGHARQTAGFDLLQLVGEFRAMRASVLRLWSHADAAGLPKPAAEEIARFNEALDQALAESVERYAADAAESRELFLAVLGHDVRSPLSTIRFASDLLLRPTLPDPMRIEVALRIRRASETIGRLTTDMLEYARTRLGCGMAIELREADLRPVCEEAVDAVRSSHPGREIVRNLSGDLTAACDPARIQQLLANLLNNAVQHGDSAEPVRLEAAETSDAVVLKVTNFGPPIPADAFETIFEPLVQLPGSRGRSNEQTHDERLSTSLGLGLFVVREIVRGHQGTIRVESLAEAGTVFTVELPKGRAAA